MGNEKDKLNKNRRKIIIINKMFQLSYFIKIFMTTVLILSFLLMLIYWWNINYVKQILTSFEVYDEGLPAIVFKETIPPIFHLLLLISTLSFFLGVAELFVSHRIAGPMFRLKKTMKLVEDGFYNLNLVVRKRDELKDVVASFNNMLAAMVNKEKEEIRTIKGLEDRLNLLITESENSTILKKGQEFKSDLEQLRKKKESYFEKREI